MSVVATLRKGVSVVLTEAEIRTLGVLEAAQQAVSAFVFVTFAAATTAVNAVVDIAFDLAGTAVEEAFNVAESITTAALGELPFDEDELFTDKLDVVGDFEFDDDKNTEEGN